MFKLLYLCLKHSCLNVFSGVHLCLSQIIHIYLYLPLFTGAYLIVFNYDNTSLPMYTHVYLWLSMITRVCHVYHV